MRDSDSVSVMGALWRPVVLQHSLSRARQSHVAADARTGRTRRRRDVRLHTPLRGADSGHGGGLPQLRRPVRFRRDAGRDAFDSPGRVAGQGHASIAGGDARRHGEGASRLPDVRHERAVGQHRRASLWDPFRRQLPAYALLLAHGDRRPARFSQVRGQRAPGFRPLSCAAAGDPQECARSQTAQPGGDEHAFQHGRHEHRLPYVLLSAVRVALRRLLHIRRADDSRQTGAKSRW